MEEAPKSRGEEAQEIFAEFVQNRGTHASSEFVEWVKRYPDLEEDLHALNGALRQIEPHLPTGAVGEFDEGGDSLDLEGELEVGEELGRGGYGRVHRAFDPVLHREVALKVLSAGANVSTRLRRRFIEEARVLASLDHPNIVRIHSVVQHEGDVQLSLELVSGRTLQEIVDQDGPFSTTEAACIGVDLCSALAAIHGSGLAHLDIKPGNVMRSEGGRIVLLDFGFARPAEEEAEAPLGGTPPFMSPEHFERPIQIGSRSDIYSLGVLLYWIVAGRYPYDFDDLAGLRENILAGNALPLLDVRPGVDRDFAIVIERAMARNEEDRFASVGELERALRSLLDRGAGSRSRSTWPRRTAILAGLVSLPLLFLGGRQWLSADSLQVEARFFRVTPAADEELFEDAQVELGDKIFLTARSETPFYLYVFNEDVSGHCFTLYPVEDQVMLPAGELLRFPNEHPGSNWEATVPAEGAEHLFVLASRRPNRLATELLELIPAVDLGEPSPRVVDFADEDFLGLARGFGRQNKGAGADRLRRFDSLEEVFREYEDQIRASEDVVLYHLRLESP